MQHKGRYYHADKRRTARLPRGNNGTTHRSKWKLLIIRNLRSRPWRFNELRKDLEGISQKVLTDSLREMEADGIITRTVYPEVPPRVEYALSPLGETLGPILDAMAQWGNDYKNM